MKTTSALSAPRYRNDAVFRSAQRLLATPPPKPPPRRPSRWLVFVAGIVLGVGLGTFSWKFWREASAEPAADRITATQGDHAHPLVPRANRTPPGPAGSDLKPPAGATNNETARARSGGEGIAPRVLSVGGSFVTPAEFATAIPNASRAPGEWTTSPVLTITLAGELQNGNAAPVECEFVLRRAADGKSKTVSGIIRFLSGEKRLAAYSLAGTFEDHTVRLRDSDTIWSLQDLVNPLLKPAPTPSGHREFELNFPVNRNATEITGTWKIDGQGGPLSLHPAAPW